MAGDAVRRPRGGAARRGGAGPAGGAAQRGARGPRGAAARARRPRHRRGGAGVADRGLPAARAAVGAAGGGAGPGRSPGRRPRRAPRGARGARPTSSASNPAPSCATCRPRCSARTRRSPGGRPSPCPPPHRPAAGAHLVPGPAAARLAAGRSRRPAGAAGRRARRRRTGAPRFAALTGEPGIGKSRLCGELAARAVADGAKVVVGRCSQDDGAPPLWPWRQVLRGLGAELAVPDADDEGAEFRTWEAITRPGRRGGAGRDRGGRARRPALGRPVQPPGAPAAGGDRGDRSPAGRSAPGARHPEPVGALADAAEALARRHAVRLELHGLTPLRRPRWSRRSPR